MTALSVRFREEGMQQGMQQGMQKGIQQGVQQGVQQGEAGILLRLIRRKFGHQIAEQYQERIKQADPATLEHWADSILSAETANELFAKDNCVLS
jgi:flagellar biosynthesis/type III secretory pathway protein FliH